MNDICDTHLHVFGSADRYPMVGGRKYDPPALSVADYETRFAPLGVGRLVLIQPSCYGADNECMLDALSTLGERGRAVVAVSSDVAESELRRMHALGARGIRVNAVGGSTLSLDQLREIAPKLRRRGWHVQTFLPTGRLPEWTNHLLAMELPIVLDHFGTPDPKLGTAQPTMQALARMLDTGRCWVKLSAPFRVSRTSAPFADLVPYAQALLQHRPDRLVWGSDWPYIHFIDKLPPDYNPVDVIAAMGLGGTERDAVFLHNPSELYEFA